MRQDQRRLSACRLTLRDSAEKCARLRLSLCAIMLLCREALEAEAQKVAQLAVNAEGSVNKYKKALEEWGADLAAAQAAAAEAETQLVEVQEALQVEAAARGTCTEGQVGRFICGGSAWEERERA